MAPVMDIDSYGFSQPSQSPFHRMSLSSDRLPNPGVEFPLTGNGLARDVFSSMKYPTSSTSSAQPFQPPFFSVTSVDDMDSANPSPASDANWIARIRAERDDSGYRHMWGTYPSAEHTTSPIGDASWLGTTEYPTNHQREESQRAFQPDLFRRTPGNPYPQPSSSPCPVPVQSTHTPPPILENRWGSPHHVQSALTLPSMYIQPTVVLESSHQHPTQHHSSNLHQGEIEPQNNRCHRLPTTGRQTSSEHEVTERNQFHAGHPGERYVEWCSPSRKETETWDSQHEEYEPLYYPAQRDSATCRRQYDISNPPFDMQSQIPHLEPATTFPPYYMGPLPSSFSSTMELFSGLPSSSNLIAFQFEEDFRTNKSAKVTLLKHVVPQVLFTDPMTLENRPQYDDETDEDSDSEEEEEEEEEESDEEEESNPDGAERRS
ncbi:hypothetical protein CPB84DRAFT_1805584 [Gymnopilus junonius]|uniref:Uncharacterized protein n=1 Tax=Gymnopilus junonius TaxID=109634 RepID=A0A9P5N785_GYMJU|nr:hypothetical protein CPB84DRAFT_1805584 [Gymnopilus junonius]